MVHSRHNSFDQAQAECLSTASRFQTETQPDFAVDAQDPDFNLGASDFHETMDWEVPGRRQVRLFDPSRPDRPLAVQVDEIAAHGGLADIGLGALRRPMPDPLIIGLFPGRSIVHIDDPSPGARLVGPQDGDRDLVDDLRFFAPVKDGQGREVEAKGLTPRIPGLFLRDDHDIVGRGRGSAALGAGQQFGNRAIITGKSLLVIGHAVAGNDFLQGGRRRGGRRAGGDSAKGQDRNQAEGQHGPLLGRHILLPALNDAHT